MTRRPRLRSRSGPAECLPAAGRVAPYRKAPRLAVTDPRRCDASARPLDSSRCSPRQPAAKLCPFSKPGTRTTADVHLRQSPPVACRRRATVKTWTTVLEPFERVTSITLGGLTQHDMAPWRIFYDAASQRSQRAGCLLHGLSRLVGTLALGAPPRQRWLQISRIQVRRRFGGCCLSERRTEQDGARVAARHAHQSGGQMTQRAKPMFALANAKDNVRHMAVGVLIAAAVVLL